MPAGSPAPPGAGATPTSGCPGNESERSRVDGGRGRRQRARLAGSAGAGEPGPGPASLPAGLAPGGAAGPAASLAPSPGEPSGEGAAGWPAPARAGPAPAAPAAPGAPSGHQARPGCGGGGVVTEGGEEPTEPPGELDAAPGAAAGGLRLGSACGVAGDAGADGEPCTRAVGPSAFQHMRPIAPPLTPSMMRAPVVACVTTQARCASEGHFQSDGGLLGALMSGSPRHAMQSHPNHERQN